MAQGKLVDKSVLKMLFSANALNAENFRELAGKTFVEEVRAGKTIFRMGDVDRNTIYLLEGQVVLTDEDGKTTTLTGGSDVARHPLGNNQPRRQTAKAGTNCKITRIDSDLLELLLTWDQLSRIEVSEIQVAESGEDDDSDWMTRILQSRAFLRIPPANIQAMFTRMEEVSIRAGEVVIRQGDDGDYYILKTGNAKVTRSSKTGAELTLAQLRHGDAFGEEALLSGETRNATITMTTDGTLMRLSKEDFNTLLKEPMLNSLTCDEAGQKVTEGGNGSAYTWGTSTRTTATMQASISSRTRLSTPPQV